ncbi:MAG TPA: alpha/beta hydrolase [Acidimicrobiia bacterium]|nr:alpha/beta hydrolase [Acidimicrobiia bacterium]
MRLLRRLFTGFVLWRLFGPVVSPRFRSPQEHPWRHTGHTVFVGDQEFLVRDLGPDEAPPLLLIHGLAGSSLAEWYRIGPALAEKYRVVMVDHRSHGLAPLARDRFDVEEVADDMAGVLDRLGIGVVTVVGYSMGGAIAQSFAHRHPARVDRLVLIATFTHHPEPMRTLRVIGTVIARGWERLTGLGTPEVRTGYLLATGAVEQRHARWLWEETHRRDTDAGAQATLALLRFDSRPWIGRIEAETLVIIPTHDQLVPPSWQYALGASVTNATIVELIGVRHEAPWTHSDLLADEITHFVG